MVIEGSSEHGIPVMFRGIGNTGKKKKLNIPYFGWLHL
jgi:hypothetical protein